MLVTVFKPTKIDVKQPSREVNLGLQLVSYNRAFLGYLIRNRSNW